MLELVVGVLVAALPVVGLKSWVEVVGRRIAWTGVKVDGVLLRKDDRRMSVVVRPFASSRMDFYSEEWPSSPSARSAGL